MHEVLNVGGMRLTANIYPLLVNLSISFSPYSVVNGSLCSLSVFWGFTVVSGVLTTPTAISKNDVYCEGDISLSTSFDWPQCILSFYMTRSRSTEDFLFQLVTLGLMSSIKLMYMNPR